MTAIAVGSVRTKPGKIPDFRALCVQMGPVAAKHGLRTRLYFSFLAGAEAATHSLVYEAPDLGRLGAGLEALVADSAFAPVNARMFGEDGVATLLSFSQANEVPL
jgi:hypothetical protein